MRLSMRWSCGFSRQAGDRALSNPLDEPVRLERADRGPGAARPSVFFEMTVERTGHVTVPPTI
jgi:hypothetical protein